MSRFLINRSCQRATFLGWNCHDLWTFHSLWRKELEISGPTLSRTSSPPHRGTCYCWSVEAWRPALPLAGLDDHGAVAAGNVGDRTWGTAYEGDSAGMRRTGGPRQLVLARSRRSPTRNPVRPDVSTQPRCSVWPLVASRRLLHEEGLSRGPIWAPYAANGWGRFAGPHEKVKSHFGICGPTLGPVPELGPCCAKAWLAHLKE